MSAALMDICTSGPQLRVKRTMTVPEFDFAYTDPASDFDVSWHMENSRGVELGMTQVRGMVWWMGIHRCSRDSPVGVVCGSAHA